MLALVLWPCADEHESVTATEVAYSSPDDPGHSHHAELCSPFCTCHCCQSQVMAIQGYSFDTPSANYILDTGRETSIPIPFHCGIWEPPEFIS